MKLKVCGMKYRDNIIEVDGLRPEYIGFIFYERSARFVEKDTPKVSDSTKKTGVFVDAPLAYILEQIQKHKLHVIQLHGSETPEFCNNLKITCKSSLNATPIEVIKVFSIKDEFDFSVLKPYESVCDYYLFDTKGKLPGGNGYTFNWNVLESYPSTKPYFLSGGISLEEVENIKEFQKSNSSKYCYAIDVNSGFEIEPGLKNIEKIKEFKEFLSFRT